MVIVQNDIGNRYSTTVVAAVTSKMKKPDLPTHVLVERGSSGISVGSVILLDQIRTLDKSRLLDYIGSLDRQTLSAVDRAFFVSIGIEDFPNQKNTYKKEEHKNDEHRTN